MNRVHDEPLRMLTRYDWAFLGFTTVTIWYLLGNIFEWVGGYPGDILPLLAGIPVVVVGWSALRLGIRLQNAVDRLDDGAGLANASAVSIDAFHRDLGNKVSLWSNTLGCVVSVIIGAGFYYLLTSGQLRWDPFDIPLLAVVTISAGFMVGLLLGRLIGYGHLMVLLERHDMRLTGLSTPQARLALRGLERVFQFSILTASACCIWFAVWWIVWNLGYMLNYWEWRFIFLPLWLVSFTVLAFAGRRPAHAFHRRLDELYGGAAARRALDQQLVEAREDLIRFGSASNIGRQSDADELNMFINELSARRFRSFLLNPKVLDLALFANILVFASFFFIGQLKH